LIDADHLTFRLKTPWSSPGRAGSVGVHGRVIGGGFYRFPLSPSPGLVGFIGAGLRRRCDAVSGLWWTASAGRGAERSRIDTQLFERGWFSGRSS